MARFQAHDRTIADLLSRHVRHRVVLPEFQRPFSWESSHVERFWADLLEFAEEYSKDRATATYFLGSIVLIPREGVFQLLDGQQRLATATIALAAMRDVAKTLNKGDLTPGHDLARDIHRDFITKDDKPATYALTLGELDEPYFRQAIKTVPPAFQASKLRSHALIEDAYKRSLARVQKLVEGKTIQDAVETIAGVKDALTQAVGVVAIHVESEEDAYRIFETLNERGLRLSVPDLVLNLLMRRAKSGEERAEVRKNWNEMIRQLGRIDASRFLRHFWVSRYGDLKSEPLFSAIRRRLEEGIESVSFSASCADEAEDYVALLEGSVALPTKAGRRDLLGVVRYLSIAAAPPLLLAGFRSLSPHDFEKLLRAIVTTYVRYIMVSNQNPLDLEDRMYLAARSIRGRAAEGKSSNAQLNVARDALRELVVSDKDVAARFPEIVLERGAALFVMTQLANELQSTTKEIGMDQANLEHVFPQKAKADDWPNLDDLEPLLWNPGNLTILGEKLNRQAQNKPFAEKASQYYSKSEIEMTKALLDSEEWTDAAIRARAKKLGALITKAYPALN